MPDPGTLRRRIAAALDDSMDRCARCKVCDAQVDAVMAVVNADRDELRRELGRFQRQYRMLEDSGGDRIGYCVVTYNQASHWPAFDYSDLHTELEDAVHERDHKRGETAKISRHETHVVAEVIKLEEGDDA